jgi:hypothetical protein
VNPTFTLSSLLAACLHHKAKPLLCNVTISFVLVVLVTVSFFHSIEFSLSFLMLHLFILLYLFQSLHPHYLALRLILYSDFLLRVPFLFVSIFTTIACHLVIPSRFPKIWRITPMPKLLFRALFSYL